MFLRTIKKSNGYVLKKLLIASALPLSISINSKIFSQPTLNSSFLENSKYSNKSFVTKAIDKTGASVVTIKTHKYVKQKEYSIDSQIFRDPYFEKFFGLQFPYKPQPRIDKAKEVVLYSQTDL